MTVGAKDRYFTVLPEELAGSVGLMFVTMPWSATTLWRSRLSAFRWFKDRDGQYIVPADYLTPWDAVTAARTVWRASARPVGPLKFDGADVTALLGDARARQRAAVRSASFVQYDLVVARLASRGFQMSVFVDMFENMISEKPQVMAPRRHMPGVLTVGFQHFMSPPPLQLNLFSSRSEAAIAPHPDVIVCSSEFTRTVLANEGFPAQKLRVGPSLRYLDLPQPEEAPEPDHPVGLAVLPLDGDARERNH